MAEHITFGNVIKGGRGRAKKSENFGERITQLCLENCLIRPPEPEKRERTENLN